MACDLWAVIPDPLSGYLYQVFRQVQRYSVSWHVGALLFPLSELQSTCLLHDYLTKGDYFDYFMTPFPLGDTSGRTGRSLEGPTESTKLSVTNKEKACFPRSVVASNKTRLWNDPTTRRL